jgi:hypothetical protein
VPAPAEVDAREPVRDPRAPARPRPRAWRAFLGRWGISLASLLSGTVTLVGLRRGVPHVGWVLGYLVSLGVLFAVVTRLRPILLARGRRRWVMLGDYTVQTLTHGLLLFVLPGYFASTTLDGATAPFFLLLLGATLLTTIDPWYQALVHPRPWLARLLLAGSLFAGLAVALGLLGVSPGGAALLAAALAGFTVGAGGGPWPAGLARRGVVALASLAAAWLALPAIPPAPVSLVRPTITRGLVDREPQAPLTRIGLAELRAGEGLVAFTPVAAPPGLAAAIDHVWRHEGRPVLTVRLLVQGGRAAGFRTFSRKSDFPPDAVGRWTVDVRTAAGQLVGRLRFAVDA